MAEKSPSEKLDDVINKDIEDALRSEEELKKITEEKQKPQENLYEVLGVSQKAKTKEIKEAFEDAYDRIQKDDNITKDEKEAAIIKLTRAKDILMNRENRREHNKALRQAEGKQGAAPAQEIPKEPLAEGMGEKKPDVYKAVVEGLKEGFAKEEQEPEKPEEARGVDKPPEEPPTLEHKPEEERQKKIEEQYRILRDDVERLAQEKTTAAGDVTKPPEPPKPPTTEQQPPQEPDDKDQRTPEQREKDIDAGYRNLLEGIPESKPEPKAQVSTAPEKPAEVQQKPRIDISKLQEKMDRLEDLDEDIEKAKAKGTPEERKNLEEQRKKLSKERDELLEQATGENVSETMNRKLKARGLKRFSAPEAKKRMERKVAREILDDDYQKAKEILLKDLPPDIKKRFESDDQECRRYFWHERNPYDIKESAYFRLIANGVRVDQAKAEKTSARVLRGAKKIVSGIAAGIGMGGATTLLNPVGMLVGGMLGAGAGTVASIREIDGDRIQVPLENGTLLYFANANEFVDWRNQCEKKSQGDIRSEATQRASAILASNDAKAKTAEDIKKEVAEEQKARTQANIFRNFSSQAENDDKEAFEKWEEKQKNVSGLSKEDSYVIANEGYVVKKGRAGKIRLSLDGKNFTDCSEADFQKLLKEIKDRNQKQIDSEVNKRQEAAKKFVDNQRILRETTEQARNELMEKAVEAGEFQETAERSRRKMERGFARFTSQVSPIKEKFSGKEGLEELKEMRKSHARIKGAGGERRKKALELEKSELSALKENLVKQQEAWALCKNFIEQEIENNPDAPKDEEQFKAWKGNLMSWVEKFGAKYGFTDEQKSQAGALIDKYRVTRLKAQETIDGKSKKDIVESLTDKKIADLGLTEKELEGIDISLDKMSIVIKASKEITQKLYAKGDDLNISIRGGFHRKTNKGVDCIVLNQDASNKDEAAQHEIQHAKNAVYRERLYKLQAQGLLNSYREAKDTKMTMITAAAETDEVKKYEVKEKEYLEQYLRSMQKYALDRVKDEFTASLHSKENLQGKWKDMFLKPGPDKPYYYLTDIEASEEYKANPTLSEKIFGAKREYGKIIENAINAFYTLTSKGGYSEEQAIDLLTFINLEYWPANIRRLLQEKKRQEKEAEKKLKKGGGEFELPPAPGSISPAEAKTKLVQPKPEQTTQETPIEITEVEAIDWTQFEGRGWKNTAFHLKQLEKRWNKNGKIANSHIIAIAQIVKNLDAIKQLTLKLATDSQTRDLPWAVELAKRLNRSKDDENGDEDNGNIEPPKPPQPEGSSAQDI